MDPSLKMRVSQCTAQQHRQLSLQLYKVQQFRCYRSGLRHLLGEYGGIEADRQTNSSRQQAAADS
jgi:hypothetical protein